MSESEAAAIAKYLFEIGQLKRVQRSGWWLAGVKDAESVAEHSFRTALIAYVLAQLEGADPRQAAVLALFHDTAETRINDAHRMVKRYVQWEGIEVQVISDQTSELPHAVKTAITDLWAEASARSSTAAEIAKDADHLECLLQAREYSAQGLEVTEWIDSSRAALTTESARSLAAEITKTAPESWRD